MFYIAYFCFFFFSSRRRHTRYIGDWSSDVCSSDLARARRISTLDHEVRDDTVKDHTVVEAVPSELLEVRDGLRRVVVERSEERRVGKECRSRGWRRH